MDETSRVKNDIYTIISAIDEYYALSSLLGMSVRVGFGKRCSDIAGRTNTPLGTEDYEANIRAIYIHDSLAALIVPADKEELALTTLITDYRSECDFLIAYNGRSPSKVQRHLLRIWRFLSEAYNTEEHSDSEAEIIMKLRKACYKHCAYRIEKYCDTANRLNLDHFFDEVLKESSPCTILEKRYSQTPVKSTCYGLIAAFLPVALMKKRRQGILSVTLKERQEIKLGFFLNDIMRSDFLGS